MNDPVVEALLVDLLEWLATGERPYDDVMNAWRTSCPKLPVWEEATDRGLVRVHGQVVSITEHGSALLAKRAFAYTRYKC